MNPIVSDKISDGIAFNRIKDSRFKTMRLSAHIFMPLSESTNAENALLCYLLVRCCRKYPDFTTLSKKLSYLYGAELSGSVTKVGDTQCLNITVSGLDDRYAIDDESISAQLGELLCEIIFNPKVIGEAFCEDDLAQEKRQTLDMIDSEFSDKRVYASQRLIEEMCANEAFGIKRMGTKERVSAVTAQDVYRAWLNMLKTARFEFIFTGDADPNDVRNLIASSFGKIDRQFINPVTAFSKGTDGLNDVVEEMDVAQSKLEMGFIVKDLASAEDINAARLMSAILGGTASSKLFTNVREKKSLCYYCASRFIKLKGIMMVESGVETSNIAQTREAVLAEIEDMKNGVISDFEIQSAKLAVVNSFFGVVDTVGGITGWYASQLMDGSFDTPAQAAEKINAITKEQIVSAANKLKLDTVFVLRSKGLTE